MHPIIEEINRVFSLGNLQAQAFRRMQRVLRDEVQPMLDEREHLVAENARLTEEVARLSTRATRAKKDGVSA